MDLDIERVSSAAQVDAVAQLAGRIWTAHYVPLIGQAQVDYMLDTVQSATAISRQIATGHEYYLVRQADAYCGYFALHQQPTEAALQLSKIYVETERRRSGVGAAILSFVEVYARENEVKRIGLTVNRHNAVAIRFYEKQGFTKQGTVVQDIGNGFVMDDYRMVKHLPDETRPGSDSAEE